MKEDRASEEDIGRIQQFYDQRFAREGATAYRPKEAYRPYVELLRGVGRVLDIGCGSGHLLKIAEEAGLEVTGIDLSEESVALCNEYVEGEVVQGRAEQLPFEADRFDAVTCIGTLEHVMDPETAVQEAQRVARPGATFLYVVPNKRFPLAGTEQQKIREELKTGGAWRRFFRDNGFVILKELKDPFHLKYGGWKRVAAYAAYRLLPRRWTYQLMFVLKEA